MKEAAEAHRRARKRQSFSRRKDGESEEVMGRTSEKVKSKDELVLGAYMDQVK